MDTQFYEIHGNENSRPIIFIPAAGATRKWWHPQAAALCDSFRVIVMDLPGHGTLADKPFRIEQTLEHISVLMENEVKESALLVGISLGGYMAINYAQIYPKRVAGLLLCSCIINFNGVRGLSFRLTGFMLKRKGAEWMEQATIEGYRKRIAPELIEPVIEAGIYGDAALDSIPQISGKNYHKMLKSYSGPILVANGEDDEENRIAEEDLKRIVPDFLSSPIKSARHLTNLEQPEAFNKTIRTFADSLSW